MTPFLTTEQVRFQHELREFFAETRVADLRARATSAYAATGPLHRWLGERSWLAVGWPEEYGGLGRSAVEAAILHREIVRHGFTDLGYVVSICYVGNFLLLAGNESLKKAYLPRLASGEISSCTLYSEPGVGSDLGSLHSRAELVDGAYRLYGTKIYSQHTRFADYALVAARAATAGKAKHEGITLFWVPLRAPGVTVRDVPNLSDEPFSEVVLDGVEVPRDHVVAPPDRGWPLLNAALSIERTGFEAHLKMRYWLDSVLRRAGELGGFDNPVFADALVALDARVEAGGVLAWQMIDKQVSEEFDAVGSAMSKWYNTELAQPIARLALELDGLDGTLAGAEPEAYYREAPGLTLSAGTSEIMLRTISDAYLQVHDENNAPRPLDDPHASFRKRLARFLGSPAAGEWSALAKSNLVRLTLPSSAGGLGLPLEQSLVAAEEMGKVLLRCPYVGTVSVADAIALEGPGHVLWPLVGAIAEGRHRIALASNLTAPNDTLCLTPTASGHILYGHAGLVPFASDADSLVVLAGTKLVLVSREQAEVRTHRHEDLGHGEIYRTEFDGTPAEILCQADSPAFAQLLTHVHLRQSGYLLGLAQQAFDLTLTYTKARRQFGQAVATFQHVSFRLAALAARLHTARQLVYAQAREHPGVRSAATLALVSELARDVTADAIQSHGAYGYCESAEIQHYYRKAAVEGLLFGPPNRLRALALGALAKESG